MAIEDADIEDKDGVNYSLQMTDDEVPRHDVLLLHGELSARVGCNNKTRERVVGKHGVSDLTSNGEGVINLCEQHDLIIGGSPTKEH